MQQMQPDFPICRPDFIANQSPHSLRIHLVSDFEASCEILTKDDDHKVSKGIKRYQKVSKSDCMRE